jgi:hypothetical protein
MCVSGFFTGDSACLCLGFLQEAENKAKIMEEEISRLQERMEERNGQLLASSSTADKVPLNGPPFDFTFYWPLTFV